MTNGSTCCRRFRRNHFERSGSDFQQNEYILSKLKNFEQVRHLADEMPGGFFIYRADGNEDILYANDAMLRIFGCDTMEEFREWTGIRRRV